MALSTNDKTSLYSAHCFELQNWIGDNLPTVSPVDAMAELLAELPAIAIKDERGFVTACKRWLRVRQCVTFYEELGDDIFSYAVHNLPLDDVDAALEEITTNFHRFEGKTKGKFVLWLHRQLKRRPHFREEADVIHSFDLSISDFLDSKNPNRFANFEYVKNGDAYLIPIGTDVNGCPVIWKVPSLKLAKQLWPVSAKRLPSGKYVAVKRINGKPFAVHRLLLEAEHGTQVRAWDSDLLNFCKVRCARYDGHGKLELSELVDNLYVTSSANSAGQKSFENHMRQFPLTEDEDGNVATKEFGGWGDGTLFQQTRAGTNTPANADLGRRTGTYRGRITDCGRTKNYHFDPEDYGRLTGRKTDGDSAIRGGVEDVRALQQAWGLD